MSNSLVSILTPCYNGEKKIPIFLDSVLSQAYDNIELIFVNDGSVDGTEEICHNYQEKFEEKGYKFTYIKQDNKGQAAAINAGLQYVHGKYLTWPDSDDRLREDYVEKKVAYLEKNPNLNMVISPIRHITDDGKVIMIEKRTASNNDNFFLDLIEGRNVYYPPGGYMVTTEAFWSVYPQKAIIESPVGQNVQMLLPMAYLHKYGYIDDVLYDYIVYEDSHAHKKRSFEEALKKSDLTCDLFVEVLKSMDLSSDEYEKYVKMLEHERCRRHFYFAIQYKDRQFLNESYKQYKKSGKVMPKIWMLHILRNIKW